MEDAKSAAEPPSDLTRDELLRQVRELRDENARLRKDLKETKSSDKGPPKGITRLLTALVVLVMYNVHYFVEGIYNRIFVFLGLILLGKLVGLPFAPLQVPSERRIQTLMVLLFFPIINMFEALAIYIIYLWYFRYDWKMLLPMLLYTVWIFIDETPKRGGYKWCKKFFRNFPTHRIVAKYYPSQLIKTADLPPDQNYLFGYHPHGVISVGAQTNFSTDSTGFAKLFPGIDITLMTLKLTFRIPFFREWCLAHGLSSCGAKSCDLLLSPRHSGKAIMLVIGGAAESLDSRPGIMDLTILNRKGFVRVALRNGAWLVPCITFGENDVYAGIPNERGSMVRQIQNWLQKKLGVAPVLFMGRGVFNYAFGILPHRRPLTSVVGAPLQCPHVPEVKRGDKIVDEWHEKYIKALKDLHDSHKEKYGNKDAEMRLF
uniref:Acyltransferase n=1 Tax=Lotharella globosa TaxID=91324 RepID=A0A6V3P7F3_9EUKA